MKLQVPPRQAILLTMCIMEAVRWWHTSPAVSSQWQLRHAGSEALSLSLYASFDNITFDLGNNECVCEPCYRDYTRNEHNRENIIPRWAKIKHNYYAQQISNTKHCIYCCGSVCECEHINQWGPDNWYGEDDISTWKLPVAHWQSGLCYMRSHKPCMLHALSPNFWT